MTSRNLASGFDGSIDNTLTTRGRVESGTPVPELTAPLMQANSQRPSSKRNNLSNFFLRTKVTIDPNHKNICTKDDDVSPSLKSGHSNKFFVGNSGTVTKDLTFEDSLVNTNNFSRQDQSNNHKIRISQCTSKFSPERSTKTKSRARDSNSPLGRRSPSPLKGSPNASMRKYSRATGALRALMNKKYAEQERIKQVQEKNLLALNRAETFKFKTSVNLDKIKEKDRKDIDESTRKLMFAAINKKLKEKNQIFNVDDSDGGKSQNSKVSTISLDAAETLEIFLGDVDGIEKLDDYFLKEERLKIVEQNIVTKPLVERL